MRKTHNKELPFIKDGWTGNPLDSKGRYKNLDGHSARGIGDVFKWKVLQKNKYAPMRKGQVSNLNVTKNTDFLDRKIDGITWLGHATFVIIIDGVKIITDPVLFDIWPLKRFTELPCAVDDLTGFDVILLSHNHRDHADQKSMKKITSLNPYAVIYTGLETGRLLSKWKVKNQIVEAGWYQEYPKVADQVKITYLPARHWGRRYLHDLNRMLWGSFMINGPTEKLYFGADSGLGGHFEEIGSLFEIDTAILGVGAYEPIWFMHPSHTSPTDAIEACKSLKCNRLIPMHYGTFDLSDEPVFYPRVRLAELSNRPKNNNLDIVAADIGQRIDL